MRFQPPEVRECQFLLLMPPTPWRPVWRPERSSQPLSECGRRTIRSQPWRQRVVPSPLPTSMATTHVPHHCSSSPKPSRTSRLQRCHLPAPPHLALSPTSSSACSSTFSLVHGYLVWRLSSCTLLNFHVWVPTQQPPSMILEVRRPGITHGPACSEEAGVTKNHLYDKGKCVRKIVR